MEELNRLLVERNIIDARIDELKKQLPLTLKINHDSLTFCGMLRELLYLKDYIEKSNQLAGFEIDKTLRECLLRILNYNKVNPDCLVDESDSKRFEEMINKDIERVDHISKDQESEFLSFLGLIHYEEFEFSNPTGIGGAKSSVKLLHNNLWTKLMKMKK